MPAPASTMPSVVTARPHAPTRPPEQEDDYGSAVINAMMASAPGHALWPVVFQVMIERSNGDVQPHTQALTGWTPFPTDPLWMTGEGRHKNAAA